MKVNISRRNIKAKANAKFAFALIFLFHILLPSSIFAATNNAATQAIPNNIIQTSEETLETLALQKILTQLRFIALSLPSQKDVDNVLTTLTQAHLTLHAPDQAINELQRIKSDLSKADAQLRIAEYFFKQEQDIKANAYLSDAFDTIKKAPPSLDKDNVLQKIAILLSTKNKELETIEAIEEMTSINNKIKTLSLIQAFSPDTPLNIRTRMQQLLNQTSIKAAVHIDPLTPQNLSLFFELSYAQTLLQDYQGAQQNLNKIKPIIFSITNPKIRLQYQTALAIALTYARDNYHGITILKSLSDPAYTAWGMSSIAKRLGKTESKDSAIPLFDVATNAASHITDENKRNLIYMHIIYNEAQLGLLADAYTLAGKIKNPQEQAKALYLMVTELLKQKNIEGAKKLLNNIPYISMRIPIFFSIALTQKNPSDISATIKSALTPVSKKPLILYPDSIPISINALLSLQALKGDKEQDQNILNQALKLQALFPHDLNSIRIGTYIAKYLSQIGLPLEGNMIINQNWPFIWLNKGAPEFGETLSSLVGTLIALNRPYQAFNVATQIPTTQQQIRFETLTNIAANVAAKGKIDLALRAMNQISSSFAQANALNSIITAFSDNIADIHQEKEQVKEIESLQKLFLSLENNNSFIEEITPPF